MLPIYAITDKGTIKNSKLIKQALEDVLNNCKDWGGYRKRSSAGKQTNKELEKMDVDSSEKET